MKDVEVEEEEDLIAQHHHPPRMILQRIEYAIGDKQINARLYFCRRIN